MSLATRCTSCGTVFRVVQDQLKVSEGWVRCGRCDSVFNALEGLFDLDRDPPPEWTEPAASERPVDFRVDIEADGEQGNALERDPSLVDRIDEQIFGARRSAFGALGGIGRADRTEPDFADARFDSDSPDEAGAGPLLIDPPAPDSGARHDDSASPAFVLEAERERRWQGSRTRKLLATGAMLLTLLLIGQVVHHHRAEIAARWPVARAPLAHWCRAVDCTLGAPHRIGDVVVESTSLARGGPAEPFRLSVVLRNRAATTVAIPWVELSLTDANGDLVARRALSPDELRADRTEIGGGSEIGLLAALSTGTSRITGFTVEVFYP
jgi:predicted Zn finger-like uncharacterized protein